MNNPAEIITSVAVFVFVMFVLIIVLDVFKQTKDFEDKE
jgi:hypothetical protein